MSVRVGVTMGDQNIIVIIWKLLIDYAKILL